MIKAAYKAGGADKRGKIRDLSATGAYLIAQESLHFGTSVHVILRQRWQTDISSNSTVYLKAKVVRKGRNGIGLTFVPDHMDDESWMHLIRCDSTIWSINGLISRLAVARTLGFILAICPLAMMECRRMLSQELSNEQTSRVVHMAHLAEEMLYARRGTSRVRANPKLVIRILGESARAEDDLALQFWAGLLVAACSEEDTPDEDLGFVDLFAQLSSIHVRLLAGACDKAGTRSLPPNTRSAREFACTPAEIRRISGIHDLFRIERELQYLFDLGLMERVVTPSPFAPMEGADLNLTALGRRLCARFWGHRLPFMYRPEEQQSMLSMHGSSSTSHQLSCVAQSAPALSVCE